MRHSSGALEEHCRACLLSQAVRCLGLEIYRTYDIVLGPLVTLDADNTEDITAPALETLMHSA